MADGLFIRQLISLLFGHYNHLVGGFNHLEK
jgi:hypothetical protein